MYLTTRIQNYEGFYCRNCYLLQWHNEAKQCDMPFPETKNNCKVMPILQKVQSNLVSPYCQKPSKLQPSAQYAHIYSVIYKI